VTFSLQAAGIGVVLLDIEGTTTPIDFVHRTLFSFARERVHEFLENAGRNPELEATLAGLREEHAADVAAGLSPPPAFAKASAGKPSAKAPAGKPWRDDSHEARLESVVAYVRWLIDRDRKSRWLKELQGRIWEQGYRSGVLRGEVYPDVPPALRRWTAAGASVGIFSSGSVLAQQLLFAHSTAGDLTPFLQWHFDTAVGPKTEPASYARIAEQVAVSPDKILFVSDVTKELDAARAAEFQTLLCVRQDEPPGAGTYAVIGTFDEISP
jgi:enolase-phosphatase E1